MTALNTPLETAIQSQDLLAIEQRLKLNDSPNDRNHLGIPVLYDALKTNNLTLLSMLVKRGIDLSAPYNDNGYSAVIYCALYCQLDTLSWLLDQGLDINQTTPTGVSAMHVAAQRGELAIAQYLYTKGASIFTTTQHGETPLLISLKAKQGLPLFKFFWPVTTPMGKISKAR